MRTIVTINNQKLQIQFLAWSFFVFLILYLISAFRPFDVGTDTMTYVQGYINPRTSVQSRNIGYNALITFLRYFSDDPRFFLIIISLVTQLLIYISIVKFTKYPLFGILMYALVFYCLSLNILRQFIITALFYQFGVTYILKKNLPAYCVLITILFTIHELSIILLPLYFLSRKFLSPVYYLGLWLASAAFLFLNQVNSLFGLFKQADTFLRIYMANLPNYFSEVEKLSNSEVSLNGVILDQIIFATIFYLIFYSNKIKVTPTVIVFFNIFFAGIILQNLFFFIQIIQRVSIILIFANIYLASITFYKLYYRIAYLVIFCLLFYVRFVLNGISGVFH
ncbi:EpsG family protein [Dyadobacter psychrophilus]|uniref:EpsG family protein n=1 Tax=Dyadobacter psychrophilus TaxID=651661 RepID=A0A1T5HCW4_9BACT|nr:EpsG family protein [Dyadobacter psychrophilus]